MTKHKQKFWDVQASTLLIGLMLIVGAGSIGGVEAAGGMMLIIALWILFL